MGVLVLVETVLLAVLTVLVAGLLRAYGTVLRRLHQLDGGERASTAGARTFQVQPAPTTTFGPAHDIAGTSFGGEVISARLVDVEHDTVLLFLSSGCASCLTFWSELAEPVPLPPRTRLLVVAQEAPADRPDELAELAPPGVDVLLSSQAWLDYEVPGSPHVVFVEGASGQVRGEGTGQSLKQVAQMLAQATGDPAFLTGSRAPKPSRDAAQEAAVDRELLAAGILPGDPRLYGVDE